MRHARIAASGSRSRVGHMPQTSPVAHACTPPKQCRAILLYGTAPLPCRALLTRDGHFDPVTGRWGMDGESGAENGHPYVTFATQRSHTVAGKGVNQRGPTGG